MVNSIIANGQFPERREEHFKDEKALTQQEKPRIKGKGKEKKHHGVRKAGN